MPAVTSWRIRRMTIPHPRSEGRPYIPVATYTTACPKVKINANTTRQIVFRKRDVTFLSGLEEFTIRFQIEVDVD